MHKKRVQTADKEGVRLHHQMTWDTGQWNKSEDKSIENYNVVELSGLIFHNNTSITVYLNKTQGLELLLKVYEWSEKVT